MPRKRPFVQREYIDGAGVYAFFPFDSLDSKQKGVFKIGMSTNFNKRLYGYHTALPGGLYFKCFLKNPTVNRNGMVFARYYEKIEKEIFKDIKEHGGEVIEMDIRHKNQGETEWVYASEQIIEDAFDRAYEKYKGKRTDLIIGDFSKLPAAKRDLERNKLFKGEIYFT